MALFEILGVKFGEFNTVNHFGFAQGDDDLLHFINLNVIIGKPCDLIAPFIKHGSLRRNAVDPCKFADFEFYAIWLLGRDKIVCDGPHAFFIFNDVGAIFERIGDVSTKTDAVV